MIDQQDTNFSDANPFRSLNKKAFRAAADRAPSRPEKKPSVKKRRPSDPTAPAADDDAAQALFLASMEHVHSLKASPHIESQPTEDATAWPEAPLPFEGLQPLKTKADRKAKKHARVQAMTGSTQASAPQEQAPPIEEEAQHFMQAMQHVAPLLGKGREVLPEPEQPATAPQPEGDLLREFMEGKLEFALHYTDEYVEGHVVGLDLLTVGKLQAGQLSPEGHLDLHGLNAQQAYPRLVGFIRNAYLRSQRTVLIVTGRGLNSPNGIGVLRDKVQTWMTQEPLRRVVLAFCTAQQSDGGAGALYVLLRKFRKDQGKVHWDRMPIDPDLLE